MRSPSIVSDVEDVDEELRALGLEENEDDEEFDAAAAGVAGARTRGALSQKEQLEFYALYKQATEGDAPCDAPAQGGGVLGMLMQAAMVARWRCAVACGTCLGSQRLA